MSVLPKRFYGDPSECVDEVRKLREAGERKAERARLNKGRRIRASVKLAMRGIRR